MTFFNFLSLFFFIFRQHGIVCMFMKKFLTGQFFSLFFFFSFSPSTISTTPLSFHSPFPYLFLLSPSYPLLPLPLILFPWFLILPHPRQFSFCTSLVLLPEFYPIRFSFTHFLGTTLLLPSHWSIYLLSISSLIFFSYFILLSPYYPVLLYSYLFLSHHLLSFSPSIFSLFISFLFSFLTLFNYSVYPAS